MQNTLPLNFKVNGRNYVASVVYTKGGIRLQGQNNPKWVKIPRGYYLSVIRGSYAPSCSEFLPWALNRQALLFTVGRKSKKQHRRAESVKVWKPALLKEVDIIKRLQREKI